MTSPERVVCPRCSQDYVRRVRIIPIHRVVFLCPECDALWELDQPIVKASYTDFSAYMDIYHLPGDWSFIEMLP